jgi:hypothetical protein
MTSPVRRVLPGALTSALLVVSQGGPACQKGDGVVDGDVTVESQSRSTWRFFSFELGDVLRDDAGEPLEASQPSEVAGWDLALSQWVLATNAGSSAQADGGSVSRGALLAVAGEVDAWADLSAYDARCSDFHAVDEVVNQGGALGCGGNPPTVDGGYVEDSLDDPDGAGPFSEVSFHPSLTFWFEYDFSSHEVHPYGHVYVVETHDGRCVKLQLTDYYDASGDGGWTSFSWAWLP